MHFAFSMHADMRSVQGGQFVFAAAQALYKRVTEYLELEQRVTVLNNRFEVLTELLNIVREHENNLHIARLEWIVIWLIVRCPSCYLPRALA
jgi:hypothetical protein